MNDTWMNRIVRREGAPPLFTDAPKMSKARNSLSLFNSSSARLASSPTTYHLPPERLSRTHSPKLPSLLDITFLVERVERESVCVFVSNASKMTSRKLAGAAATVVANSRPSMDPSVDIRALGRFLCIDRSWNMRSWAGTILLLMAKPNNFLRQVLVGKPR